MAGIPQSSLVIATYNRGPKIQITIESVLRQSIVPNEILVVDDCSPDQTGDWVQKNYPTVRVITTSANVGTSAARNRGAWEARGDILVFLDHDDELLPHAVETLLEELRHFPEAKAAYADHSHTNFVTDVHFDNHHSQMPSFARLREIPIAEEAPLGRLYTNRSMYYALLRGNLLQQPWAIYRSTFLELGGFATEIRYCEDWDMYLRVARAVPLVLSDRVIAKHLVEGGNLHLADGQDEMHRRVMRRQLRHCGWRDPRAWLILHERLGMSYKSLGDRFRAHDLHRAWKAYLQSMWAWPLDYVVVARAIGWMFLRALGRKR